jgi:hypothetical protein
MKLNLIDEYQFCIHSVVAGNGLALFEGMTERNILKLAKTKTLKGGAIILSYRTTDTKPKT